MEKYTLKIEGSTFKKLSCEPENYVFNYFTTYKDIIDNKKEVDEYYRYTMRKADELFISKNFIIKASF